MTAQQVLCEYVDKYIQLSSRFGASSRKAADAYAKLKDLLLVEIYFMKSVRILVHEEELSGFVIYVEKSLQDIVDSYRSERSKFLPYFRHVMEYRALSYLAENRRRAMTSSAYEDYYIREMEEVAERSCEEIFMEREERLEAERKQKKLMDRLRYVCACRPGRRTNLFIFMCTLLPNLSSDAIDDFCTLLNCNREQTFAIADYLWSVQNGDSSRGSRTYLRNRRDYFWMRKMEMEYSFDHSDRQDRMLSDNISRISSLIANTGTDRRKMNVEYPVLGELLNLEPTLIATAVHSSRKLISVIMGEGPQDGYIAQQAQKKASIRPSRLPKFDPFKVFGIKIIKKPTRYADAS